MLTKVVRLSQTADLNEIFIYRTALQNHSNSLREYILALKANCWSFLTLKEMNNYYLQINCCRRIDLEINIKFEGLCSS